MEVHISGDASMLGEEAGSAAALLIADTIRKKGNAAILLATGSSQFETLHALISSSSIDWSKVVMFHLDEYIGLSASHKASFRKYLRERFISKVPELKAAYLINGENDPVLECRRLNELICHFPIDVALVGIGENGHLAFNDPPADFETEAPYLIVELDQACRQQQVNEGWYANLDEVPKQAISMSIQQIMKSAQIICSVPDARKAVAVKNSLEGAVTNLHPASILQRHPHCSIYLDKASAALLS